MNWLQLPSDTGIMINGRVMKFLKRFDGNDVLSILGMFIICGALAYYDLPLAILAIGVYMVILSLIGLAKG